MNRQQLIKISKFLSYVLRHRPGEIGLTLDNNGWADVDELLEKSGKHGMVFSRDELERVVVTNDKKRFALSPDGKLIRASQGHSVEVDLQLDPVEPPEFLYHGTVGKFLNSIMHQGLVGGNRQYVHLTADVDNAEEVGMRRGKPVILRIAAKQMFDDGDNFFLSKNGVWLTDFVKSKYIEKV